MLQGTAAFLFFQVFFSVFVFSPPNQDGARELDLLCPACGHEFAMETPTLDRLAEITETAPTFFFPEPLYQCPRCRFVSPERGFEDLGDGEYGGAFIKAAGAYAQSGEYQALAAEAPPCFLFARLIEKGFAALPAQKLLSRDIFPGVDRYVAGMFYAMASAQAEGTSWYGVEYAKNPQYIELGLKESLRCLDKTANSREYPEALLMAAYLQTDASRRLGDFGTAKARLAIFQFGYKKAIRERDVWHLRPGLPDALDKLSDRQAELIGEKDRDTPVRPGEYIGDPGFILMQ